MALRDRINFALGWIGGAATMYWTLALGIAGAVWATSWAVRTGVQRVSLFVAR